MAENEDQREIPKTLRPTRIPPDASLSHTRRSVYFVDRLPATTGPNGTTGFVTSDRENNLSIAKSPQKDFIPDRETPIWPISEAALNHGQASNRLQQLAKAKPLCALYEFQRTCYNPVSAAAKKATASQRTTHLARPNSHKVWPGTDRCLDPGFTRPVTEVSAAATTANCGPRTTELAEHRELSADCLPERPLPIPVAESALQATASKRLKTLGQPVRARDKWVAEDENAPYRVSEAARRCVPSTRTVELALPIRVKGVKV